MIDDQEEAHYWLTIRDFQALCNEYGVDRVFSDAGRGLSVSTLSESRAEQLLGTVDDLRLKVLNYILWDMKDTIDGQP
jgi:hypothetical protein